MNFNVVNEFPNAAGVHKISFEDVICINVYVNLYVDMFTHSSFIELLPI